MKDKTLIIQRDEYNIYIIGPKKFVTTIRIQDALDSNLKGLLEKIEKEKK
jgi:hypothetical protein